MKDMINCVGCHLLTREEIDRKGLTLIVYNCPEFPYMCALSGLTRPSNEIKHAASKCGIYDPRECTICGKMASSSRYGINPIHTCKEHTKAWFAWCDKEFHSLDEDGVPAPKPKRDEWLETFLEFSTQARSK